MKKFYLIFSVLLVFLALTAGCAHESESVHRETTVSGDSGTTTTTTVERDTVVHHDDNDGVLSSIFDFLGEVIALPFRIVGSLVRAIF